MFYLFAVCCNLMLNFISADNEIWGKLTLSINTISGVAASSPDQNNNLNKIQLGFLVPRTKQKNTNILLCEKLKMMLQHLQNTTVVCKSTVLCLIMAK